MPRANRRNDEQDGSHSPKRMSPPGSYTHTPGEHRRQDQQLRRQHQDNTYNAWFPEIQIRAAVGGSVHINDKHISFRYPGLEPEDNNWLDPMMDHLRSLRAETARHIDVARAEADEVMSEAALADLYADKETKETLSLLNGIGRVAGPVFLHYLLDKVVGRSGLRGEGGDGGDDGPDYDVEEHAEDSDEFEYVGEKFTNDEELVERRATPLGSSATHTKQKANETTGRPGACGVQLSSERLLERIYTPPRTPPAQIGKRPTQKRPREESPDGAGYADDEHDRKRLRNSGFSDHSSDEPSPTTSRVDRISRKSLSEAPKNKGKQPVYPPGSMQFWAQRNADLATASQDEALSSASEAWLDSNFRFPISQAATFSSPTHAPNDDEQFSSLARPPAQPAYASFSASLPPQLHLQVNDRPPPPQAFYDPSRDPRRRLRQHQKPPAGVSTYSAVEVEGSESTSVMGGASGGGASDLTNDATMGEPLNAIDVASGPTSVESTALSQNVATGDANNGGQVGARTSADTHIQPGPTSGTVSGGMGSRSHVEDTGNIATVVVASSYHIQELPAAALGYTPAESTPPNSPPPPLRPRALQRDTRRLMAVSDTESAVLDEDVMRRKVVIHGESIKDYEKSAKEHAEEIVKGGRD